MLTLLVLPGCVESVRNIDRAVKSYGDCVTEVYVLNDRIIPPVETNWFSYIYDNEWLGDSLKEAIPILIQCVEIDYFIFYKRVFNKGDENPPTFYICPRMFKSGIVLNDLVVTDPYKRCQKILNGWVEEEVYNGND